MLLLECLCELLLASLELRSGLVDRKSFALRLEGPLESNVSEARVPTIKDAYCAKIVVFFLVPFIPFVFLEQGIQSVEPWHCRHELEQLVEAILYNNLIAIPVGIARRTDHQDIVREYDRTDIIRPVRSTQHDGVICAALYRYPRFARQRDRYITRAVSLRT